MNGWGRTAQRSAVRAVAFALVSMLFALGGAPYAAERVEGSAESAAITVIDSFADECDATAPAQRRLPHPRRRGRLPGRPAGSSPRAPGAARGHGAGSRRSVPQPERAALAAARARHTVLRC